MSKLVPASSHPLALPSTFSPDAIDALTELSFILSRLKPSNGDSATNPSASQNTSQAQTALDPSQPSSSSQGTHTFLPGVTTIGDLSLRDVAVKSDDIKHKLQRAKQQIRQLPDMERTTAEQDEEIAHLKEKIHKQRQVLEMLRTVQFRCGDMEL